MKTTLSQKLRAVLNTPIKERSYLFFLLTILLYLCAFIVSIEACRRRKYRADKKKFFLKRNMADNPNLQVISVGNLTMGGAGKSPIVRFLAKEALKSHTIVAIAARGIGSPQKELFVSHQKGLPKAAKTILNFLADENREHFEILSRDYPDKEFYIYQNKDRSKSLLHFARKIESRDPDCKALFILDDGFQHHRCPRDLDICVLEPQLLLEAPPYPFPLGPYREGWGAKSLAALLGQKQVQRVWSRTDKKELPQFQKQVESCQKEFKISHSQEDRIAFHNLKFYKLTSFFPEIQTTFIEDLKVIPQNTSLVCGIANPLGLIAGLRQHIPQCPWTSALCLRDHSPFCERQLAFLTENKNFMLTLKDFYRWVSHEDFVTAVENKNVFLCELEVWLEL